MKSNFYVYEHWRMDRDECFYVGKGHGNRAYDMRRGRNRHHKAIVAKMHRIGSSVEVRIVADGLIENEAFQIEKERIKFWRDAGADLTNLTDGGEGPSGMKDSEETKRKKAMSFLGKRHTPETKAKISAFHKGKQWGLGKKRPQEAIEKTRKAHLGRKVSDEVKAKISASKKNPSLETRAKLSEAARRQNSNMTPEQRAIKAEIGRQSSKKYWDDVKTKKES